MTADSKMKNALPAGTRLVSADGQAYTLVRVLGIGGFGITYQGTMSARVGHINVDIPVAIKEFFPSSLCERSDDTSAMCYSNPIAPQVEGARKAFMSEARRLNSLAGKHNIVAVNEVFEANNTVYYVMEYIGGMSLKEYIEANGPMSEAAMLGVMRPVVEAVAFIHSEHITHLDIKPANIMLATGKDGSPVRPVLIDFGLSKHYDEQGGATSTLFGPGYSVGYSPREQYDGITTFTPTADVYALGATMLFCLTGSSLPSSLTLSDADIAAAIPAGVSASLRSVLLKALALHKGDRTPDAVTLLRQLDILGTPVYGKDDIVHIEIEDDTRFQPSPAPVMPKYVTPKPVKNESKTTVSSPKVSWWDRNYNWLWVITLFIFAVWFAATIWASGYRYIVVGSCLVVLSPIIISWLLSSHRNKIIQILQIVILLIAVPFAYVATEYGLTEFRRSMSRVLAFIPFGLWIITLCLSIFRRR